MPAMRWGCAFVLILAGAGRHPGGQAQEHQQTSWAPVVEALRGSTVGGGSEWRSVALPLALMVKLSYTQTWGSYRSSDQSEEVPGWRKLRIEANPLDGPCPPRNRSAPCAVLSHVDAAAELSPLRRGGMHAIAFTALDGSGRLVISFRGTDLSSANVSGRADSCANSMRDGMVPFRDLPSACAGFGYEQLDYVAAARRFMRAVLAHMASISGAQRPLIQPAKILTVGHSLGAHLAAMMAVEFDCWSVGFGSGGVVAALRRSVLAQSSANSMSGASAGREGLPTSGDVYDSQVGCNDGMHGSCIILPSFATSAAATVADDAAAYSSQSEVGNGWAVAAAHRLLVLNNPYDPVGSSGSE